MNMKVSTNRKFRRMFVNIVSIVIILAVAFPVTGSVYAQEPVPWLIAFPENDAIEAWEWPEGATVYLTIDNAPSDFVRTGTAEVTTWGDPRTYVRLEFADEDGYDLKVGDTVTLTDSFGTTVTHAVQNLSVTVVNTKTDTVTGTADSGAVVQVWPHEFDQIATLEMTTSDNGGWQANFGDIGFDLVEGMGGRSQILVDGNATAVDWNAYQTYDIYAYDPLTGTIQQVTYLANTDEYNPSWSPNGKKVTHDVLNADGSYGIYITDVKTGVSTPLIGAENGGNDPVWSPNGKWIAFDLGAWSEFPDLYLVPATDGVPTLIRENAVNADWAPSGKRLVFQQPNDGSIRTIAVDGGKGGETFIAESGANPAWSPDGNWIAYENNGDIWKVQVNVQGTVFRDPIQVTSGPFNDGQPTWSPDSMTIVYHSGFNDDWDLWSVPAAGGTGTWLNGAPEFGDYDPAYARNSSNIAYASFSPDGQAARQWVAAFTYDLPAGYWTDGTHTYHFEVAGNDNTEERSFDVRSYERLYDGTVLLRPGGIRARTGEECNSINEVLNPLQPTQFNVGWTADGTYSDALTYFENLMAKVAWDGGDPVDLVQHEIFPFTAHLDWSGYVCTFTAGAPAPTFVAYIPGAIEGYDWPMGDEIRISINGVDYPATAFSEQRPDFPEGTTRVLFEVWMEGISLQSGDHIVMTDDAAGIVKDVWVTNLAVTDFDLEAGTVSGIYDSNDSLWVWLYDMDGQVPATDLENGTWVATFDPLPPGSMGGATQWDADGDGTSMDFQVPSARVVIANQEDWVNSGITVSTGQSFTIEAFGFMNPCPNTYPPNGPDYCIFYTPQGAEGVVSYENEFGIFPGPGLRFMALLGRIGDGEPFYVGAGSTFTAEQAGTLWFTPNDNLRTDNQGAYTVLVWLGP